MSTPELPIETDAHERRPTENSHTAPHAAPLRPRVLVALAVVLAVGWYLRTRHLSDLSLWFDECNAWKISRFPLREMIETLARDSHPPVYHTLLKLLGMTVGDSPLVLRGCSVLFGLATSVVAFWFVWTTLDPRFIEPDDESSASRRADRGAVALLAAALTATSVLHVEMNMQARPYALGTFLALVTGTFLLRGVRAPARYGDWVGFAVSAILLSLTHYYGLFTLAAMFPFAAAGIVVEFDRMGWTPAVRRMVVGLALATAALAIVWYFWQPIFFHQRARMMAAVVPAASSWQFLFISAFRGLAAGQLVPTTTAGPWPALAVWFIIVIVLLIIGRAGGRLAALCAGVPLIAAVIHSLVAPTVFEANYFIFAQVYLLVAVALLVASIPWRGVRVLVAAGLLACNGYWCWRYAQLTDELAKKPGARSAVAYLNELRRPDEPVFVGSPFFWCVVQKYATHPEGVYVFYPGEPADDPLDGAAIGLADYQNLESHLNPPVRRAWTVDLHGLLGFERLAFQLPVDWILIGEKAFDEPFGYSFACRLVVREYRRQSEVMAE
ncbi:MAG: hypothetical protein ACT4QC_16325 [Planctomycetaceae bacterium]